MAIGPRARDGDGGNRPGGLWPAPQRHGLPIFPTGGVGRPGDLIVFAVLSSVMPKTALRMAQAIFPAQAGWPEQPGTVLPTVLAAWTAMANS